jgi:hypothetical protein
MGASKIKVSSVAHAVAQDSGTAVRVNAVVERATDTDTVAPDPASAAFAWLAMLCPASHADPAVVASSWREPAGRRTVPATTVALSTPRVAVAAYVVSWACPAELPIRMARAAQVAHTKGR